MERITGKPKIFGTGLIALDLVMGMDPDSPVRSWAGGTCGNVLSILAYLGWDSFPIARMNDDQASQRVKADMAHWGVHLDFADCGPVSNTPIVIQKIRRDRNGIPTHRFSWSCPRCGGWLPGFKAVTLNAIETVTQSMSGAAVFFMDRLSRSALTLAARAASEGAIVFFEPSSVGKSNEKLFTEALQLAHIVKYSDQRLLAVAGSMQAGSNTLLEIQTLGAQGLRYRHRLGSEVSNWFHIDAIPAPRLADTCGAGDWCTAGFVSKVACGGQYAFQNGGVDKIHTALHYGQALAAWNCGFEGARGGMYSVDRHLFDDQIDALLNGRPCNPVPETIASPSTSVACPACSPNKSVRPPRTSSPRRTLKSAVAA